MTIYTQGSLRNAPVPPSHGCYFAAAATISFVRAREIACELKSSRKFPVPHRQSWLLLTAFSPTNEWHISTEFLVLSRSLSASPLKGESVPLSIWEVGFIFELVYIIRTWKFVEIKCIRDWLCVLCEWVCVCEWDENLKLFKPLKLSQCCPLKLVYACFPVFPRFEWLTGDGQLV